MSVNLRSRMSRSANTSSVFMMSDSTCETYFCSTDQAWVDRVFMTGGRA